MNKENLYQLIAETDNSTIVSELQNGRYTALPVAETFINELEPEFHKVMNKQIRPDKKVYITDDEQLDETLEINANKNGGKRFRYEKVVREPLAIQKLIVKRAVAFLFGNPVQYSAETTNETEEALLNAVKAVLRDNKINTIDRKVARSTFSSTESAEYWYPVADENNQRYGFDSNFKLRVSVFSPLKGDELFPYFDENGDMIAFSRQYSIEDNDHNMHYYFETFTDKEHILWSKENGEWNETTRQPNTLGKIPIIYAHQNETEWADVQGLIDRLETLLSNFGDTNDYHAAPKIFVTGNIYGWSKKGESGAVIEGDKDATAQYLSWQNAPESVKLEIETLLRMIYTITQTPDISFDAVKGLNLSGVALKLLFMDAHLKVQDHAEVFNDFLHRRLSVIEAYMSQLNAGDSAFVQACKTLQIDAEILPFMLEDDQTKVSTILAAVGQKQIISQKTAIESLGWVNDAQAEADAIKAEEEASSINNVTNDDFYE